MRVELHHGNKLAVVQCSECGLKGEFDVSPADQIVDIYCKFTDKFYSGTGASKTATPVVEATPEPGVKELLTDEDEDLSKDDEDSSEDEEESVFEPPTDEETPVDETVEEETEDLEEEEIEPKSLD